MRGMRLVRLVRLVPLVLAGLTSGAALAELKIEITRGQGEAVPIAVVPFGWNGQGTAPYDIAGVVANDLARSGRFQPVPERDMLQKPTTGDAIDFGDWRIIDTQVIVVGQIQPAAGPDAFTLVFQVFDVFRGEQLLGYRVSSDRERLRATAHRISDMIFEKLTGIPGVAATRIAYVNVLGDPKQPTYRLVVADADGENARVILESLQPIMSPAWSPDGRNLAYVSFENGGSQVFVQSLRSGARKRVSARRGVNSAPSWSPDGRRLALTLSRGDGNLDVYTLEIATQVLTRLTDWPSIETEPNWSNDGREVYFTSDRTGGPQIYRIPADGGRPQRVTFEGSYNARPRVSPDGKRMVVVHNDRGNYRIAVLDLERAYLQILTDGNLDESPSFAPNGQVIIYAAREGARGVLSLVSVDGRVAQRVAATDGEVREPAWSPFPVD